VLHEGEAVLVVAAQISLDDINVLMHERTGLGESGETYMVGQDNLFRTDSRHLDELGVASTVLNEDLPVDTIATRSALEGGTDTEVIEDYRGVSVLSSWSPLVLREPDENYPAGIVWAFMAEINEAEALTFIETQTRTTLILVLVIVGLSILAAFGLAQTLTNPITRLNNTAEEIMAGNLSVQAEITTQDEMGTLAATFNIMTTQLRDTLEGLEQQVTSRTQALETSTEVSRRLSTILDQETLVREVVEQLTAAFNYYHAHIYLFDERKENLVMVGGTGDAGRSMLASGHKLEAGRGLVGRAAQTNQIVLIPDVSQAEGWLPNPLLPDTKAEVAVPIAVGDEVIGVLDVQHNVTGGFTNEDASLIQSIANQVGIAVQNAQTYQRTQRQAVREARITAINQRIQSAMSIDDVLQIAVSELGEALDANQANIELSMIAKQNRDSATRN
jgi:GAF domain-containing protein/HAMP domain-containing protein